MSGRNPKTKGPPAWSPTVNPIPAGHHRIHDRNAGYKDVETLYRKGIYAVHLQPASGSRAAQYLVDHLPTGGLVMSFPSKAKAEKGVRVLAKYAPDVGANLTFGKVNDLPRNEMNHMVEVRRYAEYPGNAEPSIVTFGHGTWTGHTLGAVGGDKAPAKAPAKAPTPAATAGPKREKTKVAKTSTIITPKLPPEGGPRQNVPVEYAKDGHVFLPDRSLKKREWYIGFLEYVQPGAVARVGERDPYWEAAVPGGGPVRRFTVPVGSRPSWKPSERDDALNWLIEQAAPTTGMDTRLYAEQARKAEAKAAAAKDELNTLQALYQKAKPRGYWQGLPGEGRYPSFARTGLPDGAAEWLLYLRNAQIAEETARAAGDHKAEQRAAEGRHRAFSRLKELFPGLAADPNATSTGTDAFLHAGRPDVIVWPADATQSLRDRLDAHQTQWWQDVTSRHSEDKRQEKKGETTAAYHARKIAALAGQYNSAGGLLDLSEQDRRLWQALLSAFYEHQYESAESWKQQGRYAKSKAEKKKIAEREAEAYDAARRGLADWASYSDPVRASFLRVLRERPHHDRAHTPHPKREAAQEQLAAAQIRDTEQTKRFDALAAVARVARAIGGDWRVDGDADSATGRRAGDSGPPGITATSRDSQVPGQDPGAIYVFSPLWHGGKKVYTASDLDALIPKAPTRSAPAAPAAPAATPRTSPMPTTPQAVTEDLLFALVVQGFDALGARGEGTRNFMHRKRDQLLPLFRRAAAAINAAREKKRKAAAPREAIGDFRGGGRYAPGDTTLSIWQYVPKYDAKKIPEVYDRPAQLLVGHLGPKFTATSPEVAADLGFTPSGPHVVVPTDTFSAFTLTKAGPALAWLAFGQILRRYNSEGIRFVQGPKKRFNGLFWLDQVKLAAKGIPEVKALDAYNEDALHDFNVDTPAEARRFVQRAVAVYLAGLFGMGEDLPENSGPIPMYLAQSRHDLEREWPELRQRPRIDHPTRTEDRGLTVGNLLYECIEHARDQAVKSSVYENNERLAEHNAVKGDEGDEVNKAYFREQGLKEYIGGADVEEAVRVAGQEALAATAGSVVYEMLAYRPLHYYEAMVAARAWQHVRGANRSAPRHSLYKGLFTPLFAGEV